MGNGFELGCGRLRVSGRRGGFRLGCFPASFSRLCFTPWPLRGAIDAALTPAAMISLTDTQSKYLLRGPASSPGHPFLGLSLSRPPLRPPGSMNEAPEWGRRPARQS